MLNKAYLISQFREILECNILDKKCILHCQVLFVYVYSFGHDKFSKEASRFLAHLLYLIKYLQSHIDSQSEERRKTSSLEAKS